MKEKKDDHEKHGSTQFKYKTEFIRLVTVRMCQKEDLAQKSRRL